MQSKEIHIMTEEERLHLQAHLRDMYLEIEKVCEKHNLRMCLGCGNVLGAIRHQGFIPWDDDLDLLMPRDDYNKLINEFADELPDSYKIFAPNSKNGAIYRFAKVVDTSTRFLSPGAPDDSAHGIFVDIFPLENTTCIKGLIRFRRIVLMVIMLIASSVDQYKSNNTFYKKLLCSSVPGKISYFVRSTIGLLFCFMPTKRWYDFFDTASTGGKPTGYVNMPSNEAGLWKYFSPYPISMYFPARKVVFNDIMAYIPNDAVKYLEIEFGDWHIIPPENERWQHFISEIRFSTTFFNKV